VVPRGRINSIDNFGVTKGTMKFVVPVDGPDVLYYVSENDPDLGGLIKFLDVTENSFIDVANDILGKKTYSLRSLCPNINVDNIARYYGGNGHEKAAGYSIDLIE
jgi:hypothetical protein